MTKLALVVSDKEPQGSPPLGVVYLASYLREYLNLSVIKIFSFIPEKFAELEDFSPDVVGISTMSPQFPATVEFSKKIKKQLGVPIIMGALIYPPFRSCYPSHAILA